jgi:hypothetical protein
MYGHTASFARAAGWLMAGQVQRSVGSDPIHNATEAKNTEIYLPNLSKPALLGPEAHRWRVPSEGVAEAPPTRVSASS